MYLPTLSPKMGELKALNEFTQHSFTKDRLDNLLPNLVITETSQDELNKIMKKFAHHTLLDTRQLGSGEIINLVELIKSSQNSQFDIVFPLSLLVSDGIFDVISPADVKYVSISGLKNISNLFLDGLKNYLDILPENIILDFGYIENTMISSELQELILLLSQKNIFILSGSVPSPVPVKSTVNYEQPMRAVELFDTILDLNLIDENHLNYGDYATNHPMGTVAPDPANVIPNVQIKYTRSNKKDFWFVRNGQRKGDYDFFYVANSIIKSPTYSAASWADSYLEDISNKIVNIGNSTTWAAIGINRHISMFV